MTTTGARSAAASSSSMDDVLGECETLYDWSINLTLHETKDLKYIPLPSTSSSLLTIPGFNLNSFTGASPPTSPAANAETLPNQWLSAKLGSQVHDTSVRSSCSSSAYDYHANFALKATLRDFGYQMMEISAQHLMMIQSGLIGRCALSVRTIFERQSHSLVRTWIDLTNLNDPAADVGRLCLSITVNCLTLTDRMNDSSKISPAVDPLSGGEKHFYSISISVYKGQDLSIGSGGGGLSEPYVEIIHGLNRQKTRVVSLNANPEWNTQFNIPTTPIPPLDDYLRISLWNGKISSTLYGVFLIPIKTLIQSGQILFWIYFYINDLAQQTGTITDISNELISSSGQYLTSIAQAAVSTTTSTAAAEAAADPTLTTVVSGWDITPRQTIGISTYAGRILCHASIKSVHAPFKPTITSCGMIQPPPTSAYDLHSQVFEIASTQNDIGPLKVEICCGPHLTQSTIVQCQNSNKTASYRFENSDGQLMPLRLMLDQQPMINTSWGVLIYITSASGSSGGSGGGSGLGSLGSLFTTNLGVGTTTRRIGVTYVSFEQLLSMGEKPSWISVKTADTHVDVFKILIRLILRPAVEGLIAPLTKAYETCRYVFRCFIYEACNLKCPNNNSNELPSPYIKCELAGIAWTTKEIYHARNPLIFQAFEGVVTLPDDLNLADNIIISVYHKNQFSNSTVDDSGGGGGGGVLSGGVLGGGIGSGGSGGGGINSSGGGLSFNMSMFGVSVADELLGRMEYSIKEVPKVWNKLPEWRDLIPADSGSVLCAFELLNMNETEQFPFYQDLRPSTYPTTVILTILGLVSHWPLSLPRIRVSYGRDLRDSRLPLWSTFTSAIDPTSTTTSSIKSSSWLFGQNIQVGLELPKRSIHFAYLEIEVYHENSYNQPILTGIISLSDIIPWYQLYELEILSDRFRQSYIGPGGRSTSRKPNATKQLEALAGGGRGGGGGDLKSQSADLNSNVKIEWRYISPESTEMKHIDPPGRDMGPEADFWIDDSEENDPVPRKSQGFRRVITVHNVNIDKLMFNLKAEEEVALTEDERRETISAPIETILDLSLLPYRQAALVSPTPNDHPVIVGQLKYLAHIAPVNSDNDTSRTREKQEFLKNRKAATDLTQDSIETRIYCLHAKDLIASDAVGTSMQFYLILDFPGVSNNVRSESTTVVDRANPRTGSLDPVFNKCYSFLVDLPQMACLRIRVMQMGTLQDEEVGCTYINLETLWWSDQYREMVKDYTLPVETRELRKFEVSSVVESFLMSAQPPRSVAAGSICLWIDMLTTAEAQGRPISVLSSPDPQPYQLRVVIWQLRNCKMGNASSISLICSGSFRQADDSLDTQWTDTHFNSRDGRAVFNWRFVFDIYIPARFSSLTLAVHQHAVIGTGELLGNCIIDLQRDFTISQRSHGIEHEIPRTWTNLVNPREPGVIQGEIEYEISVVSQKEATVQPVGKGRDEPNKNPYLEPVLENRNYVDWQGWTETLKDLGSRIAWTTKWLLIGIIVVIVIASILWLVVALK